MADDGEERLAEAIDALVVAVPQLFVVDGKRLVQPVGEVSLRQLVERGDEGLHEDVVRVDIALRFGVGRGLALGRRGRLGLALRLQSVFARRLAAARFLDGREDRAQMRVAHRHRPRRVVFLDEIDDGLLQLPGAGDNVEMGETDEARHRSENDERDDDRRPGLGRDLVRGGRVAEQDPRGERQTENRQEEAREVRHGSSQCWPDNEAGRWTGDFSDRPAVGDRRENQAETISWGRVASGMRMLGTFRIAPAYQDGVMPFAATFCAAGSPDMRRKYL